MEQQVYITKPTQLLNNKGELLNPGYATQMLYKYNRSCVAGSPFGLKEWDFYQISLDKWVLQLVMGHVSYMASFSATLFSLESEERYNFTQMRPLPMRSIPMSLTPNEPHVQSVKGKHFSMAFEVVQECRVLSLQGKDKNGTVDISLTLPHIHEDESMVIATPFRKPKQFYLNCKEHFYGVQGYARFGNITISATGKETALLDWGRGVWPYHQEWFWGCGAGYQAGGRFGFNIGWGFGNLSYASENMFFWNGKSYKLGTLKVQRDKNNYMAPWHFISDDGYLDMIMTPIYDNVTQTKVAFVNNRCHQVFGYFSGSAILPDGKVIHIKELLAFCEHAINNW